MAYPAEKSRITNKEISPDDLKTLFEAMNNAPGFLSKRFIMLELLGWSDELIAKNVKLKQEEINAEKTGDKVGAYR
jgi:hypothetical protein